MAIVDAVDRAYLRRGGYAISLRGAGADAELVSAFEEASEDLRARGLEIGEATIEREYKRFRKRFQVKIPLSDGTYIRAKALSPAESARSMVRLLARMLRTIDLTKISPERRADIEERIAFADLVAPEEDEPFMSTGDRDMPDGYVPLVFVRSKK
jgi:hypothetical protein